MASLQVLLHRSGQKQTSSVDYKIILTASGRKWTSGYIASGGRGTIKVPDNEMYTIVVGPYSSGNKADFPAYSGDQNVTFDLDKCRN